MRNCDCEKNDIAEHCWEADHSFSCDEKKVVDGDSRWVHKKIQKTLRSLKNSSPINTICYMFPETWLPYLGSS